MILYLDTRSLIKLYVEEPESVHVEFLVRSSRVTATSLVAFAESRAALARRFREQAFTIGYYEQVKNSFILDWEQYFTVNLTPALVQMAGDLAERHALRGFDSIHLASALSLREELSSTVVFSCYDTHLQKASQQEGLAEE